MYFQYEGGDYDSSVGWLFAGIYTADPTSILYGAMVYTYTFLGTGLTAEERAYDNDPCIMMFDARYPPSSNKAILRESEMYEYEPSPLIGQDHKGSMVGITTRMGLHYWSAEMWEVDGNTPTVVGDWGEDKQDVGNDVGHVETWGKNFSVGNGLCYMNIHMQGGSFWSMDLGKGADRGPVNFKDVNMLCDKYGSPYRYGDAEGSDDYRIEDVNYGYGKVHHDGPMRMEHDRATWISHSDDWNNVNNGFRSLAGEASAQAEGVSYGSAGDSGVWQQYLLRSMDLQDSRIRTHIGCDSASDTDGMQSFAVGNGRLYTCMFIEGTYAPWETFSGGLGNPEYNACRPYYANSNFRPSNFSVMIHDLNGIPRKNNWTFTGGTLLNLLSNTSQEIGYGNSWDADVNRADISQATRITAGCGRVVFFDHTYSDDNDNRMDVTTGLQTWRGFGKGWIYTQDGQFIKAISYQDENWGALGRGGINANLVGQFGFKTHIANNLIFVLAENWRLDSLQSNWVGTGRMYIFSLDGELLAAFSPFNLGFTSNLPFNFDDFVTDGVDLYMINYDNPYANNTNPPDYPLVSGGQSNTNAFAGYYTMNNYRIGSFYQRPAIYHIKLPETLSNYYDKISDTYRY